MTLLETISNTKLPFEEVKTVFCGCVCVCVYKGMREQKVLNSHLNSYSVAKEGDL